MVEQRHGSSGNWRRPPEEHRTELSAQVRALVRCAERVRARADLPSIGALHALSERLATSSASLGCDVLLKPAVLLATLLREVVELDRAVGPEFAVNLDRLLAAVARASDAAGLLLRAASKGNGDG